MNNEWGQDLYKSDLFCSRSELESSTKECNSHVSETKQTIVGIQSSTGHEKPGVNVGGPSPKAKYDLVTDRVQYREGKVKSTPEGE